MPEFKSRVQEWTAFSRLVENHVVKYSIKQYGDLPDDQASSWTVSQCQDAIRKYVNRFGRNARGEEESMRDMLKIAHYACIAYWKMRSMEEKT